MALQHARPSQHPPNKQLPDVARPDALSVGPLQDLLAKELDLLFESVVVAGEPHTGIDAVGGPATGRCDGIVGQGDDVQEGGFCGIFGRYDHAGAKARAIPSRRLAGDRGCRVSYCIRDEPISASKGAIQDE